ncbi:hypothetical protein BRO06_02305 [Xanthomonas oryzae pv. oryzae]|nr:hypothetical protein ATY45_12530 [Xanthomonas oryzae pv. oryzae]RBB62146.1 hypothetical protein BRN54_25070 [Xanthomonas oryzae pv. oryzae]RBJ55250.1 hypothetical protein BRO06_02305 [Xanthomonas oryzae pv. oryzae]
MGLAGDLLVDEVGFIPAIGLAVSLLLLLLLLCSCLAFAVRFSSSIPQRQAIRVKPHRGGAHGCARFL